jgi:hypothetical protein
MLSKKSSDRLNEEFKLLDTILNSNLADLYNCTIDQKKAKEQIKDSKRKFKWLEQTMAKVESVGEM